MAGFLNDNFLLKNKFAEKLYHGFAKDLPIIDYHNHLSPKDIANDRQFSNLTEAWLEGDHYKWRAMRTLGVEEKFITGNASALEKFEQWSRVVPMTIRNPLYHWSHLELKRYFHIDQLLTEETSRKIYTDVNEQLATPLFSTRSLVEKMNVEVLCTTDDPADTLEHHQKIAHSDWKINVYPAFRPDKAYGIENPDQWNSYRNRLGAASNIEITSFNKLVDALEVRMQYFHDHGCRLSDHGLSHLFFSKDTFSIDELFNTLVSGKSLSDVQGNYFKFTLLLELCRRYHGRGWTQQFHLGAIRNNSSRMLTTLGPDTGFDSIGDYQQAEAMSGFFDTLDRTDQLARTIVYNLNPSMNEVFATMASNFNDGSIKGKMQFGSAWWFLDQKDGMEKQLNTLSNLSLLSTFVGMLTDSRSFLSFPRHEYFRRVLCNLIGTDVANDELPWDEKWLGKIVADICYNNAKEYFRFQPVKSSQQKYQTHA